MCFAVLCTNNIYIRLFTYKDINLKLILNNIHLNNIHLNTKMAASTQKKTKSDKEALLLEIDKLTIDEIITENVKL